MALMWVRECGFCVIFDNGRWVKRPAVHVYKCQP